MFKQLGYLLVYIKFENHGINLSRGMFPLGNLNEPQAQK